MASNGDEQLRVVPADPAQRDALAALLAGAFYDDPVTRWLFPDPRSRPFWQRRFFPPFLDYAFRVGEVHTVGSGDGPDDGVALWLPVDPARPVDPAATAAFEKEVQEAVGEHAERLGVVVGLMEDAHPVVERHHHLEFIGVAPGRRNRGIGTRLLIDRLAALDALGVPSYLESTCPRSRGLYERLGFTAGTAVRLPDGPEFVPMWRPPAGP